MHVRIVAIFVIFFLLPAAQAAQDSIVGVWYEDVTYGGSRVISVWDIKPDGTFTSVYRRCLPEGESSTSSTGTWTSVNGRTRTVTQGNGAWPVIDEYQTESNDGHIWVYRGAAGNGFEKYGPVRFRDIRVGPDSKLPTCDLTS
jgi:hypothetical protein